MSKTQKNLRKMFEKLNHKKNQEKHQDCQLNLKFEKKNIFFSFFLNSTIKRHKLQVLDMVWVAILSTDFLPYVGFVRLELGRCPQNRINTPLQSLLDRRELSYFQSCICARRQQWSQGSRRSKAGGHSALYLRTVRASNISCHGTFKEHPNY